jgi:hypothetical protein
MEKTKLELPSSNFEIQARTLLACYSGLIKLVRTLTQSNIDDSEVIHLIAIFTNSHYNKSLIEKAKILRESYVDRHPYFRILAELYERPMVEDITNSDFFTLSYDKNNKIKYRNLHHLDKKTTKEDETEILSGFICAINIPNKRLDVERFPNKIKEIFFVEIEPGQAAVGFQRLVREAGSDSLFLEFFCSKVIYYFSRYLNRNHSQANPIFTTKKRGAICFIEPRPNQSPPYIFKPPLLIVEEGTNISEILKNGWKLAEGYK